MIAPTLSEQLARARLDLRLGLPVVLRHAGLSVSVLAAETVSQARLERLGDAVLALSKRRAAGLRMAAYDGEMLRIRLWPGVRAEEIIAIADPVQDLDAPLKGPFRPLRSEAEPLRQLSLLALNLVKSARLLPAGLVAPGAWPGALSLDSAAVAEGLAAPLIMRRSVSARLPMRLAEAGQLTVFRAAGSDEEHVAVEIGTPARDAPVLARLHSACFTGDILGSLKCDCGAQLAGALAAMNAEGSGVLLYLNQEGRGIGLVNKMRAYRLQDQGFDTVEANHRLGFEDDERDFRIGAAMLRALGFDQVRLLTNNPAKIERLQGEGVAVVERVPLAIEPGDQNRAYLAAKAHKSGHLL